MECSQIWQAVLAQMSESAYVCDRGKRILYTNPAMQRLTGWTEAELVGQRCDQILATDLLACAGNCPMEDAIAEGRSLSGYEGSLRTRSGTLLAVRMNLAPLYDSQAVVGVVVLLQEIIAARRTELTLHEPNERERAEEGLDSHAQERAALHEAALVGDAQQRAVDRKPAEDALARRVRELGALYEMAMDITAQQDVTTLLHTIVRRAAELLGMHTGELYLMRPDGETLEMVDGHNLPRDYIGSTLRLGEGLSGRVAQTGAPLAVADHCAWEGRADVYADAPCRRVLGVPLRIGARILGVINVADPEQVGEFTEDEIRLVSALADYAAIALERAQLYEQAQRELQQRTRAEEALAQQEAYYRRLIQNSSDILMILSDEGAIRFVSPSLQRILGYDPTTMQGLNALSYIHPDDLPTVGAAFAAFARTPGDLATMAFRLRHANGSWVPVEQSSHNLLQDPLIQGILVNLRDISERQRLEEELRQSQKMEAIGRLAGGVAHDFNNLLTVINGYSQLLLGGLPAGDVRRQDVQEIARAGERAAALTRQLLAFSRRQMLEMRILNLNEVLEGIGKMLRRLIGEDINLEMRLAKGLGLAKADPGQIEQVVTNLVVNARDAMPSGGLLILETANVDLDRLYTLEHLEVAPGPYVMLSLRDTGQGMTDEVREHLFEPFFTTKGVGKGTGLGLATVYGIIKQSGGDVDVVSAPGRGSTFRIYLPRVDAPSATAPSDDEAVALLRGQGTILVVEDGDEVRALTERMVQHLGYRALSAASAAQALHLVESAGDPIHLVLTDVVMPEMSGPALVEALHRLKPDLPVVYMSGYAEDAFTHHGMAAAGAALLQKPFTLEALSAKLREALG